MGYGSMASAGHPALAVSLAPSYRILHGLHGKYSKDHVPQLYLIGLYVFRYSRLKADDKSAARCYQVLPTVEVYPQAQLASAAARRAFGLSGYRCSWVD